MKIPSKLFPEVLASKLASRSQPLAKNVFREGLATRGYLKTSNEATDTIDKVIQFW